MELVVSRPEQAQRDDRTAQWRKSDTDAESNVSSKLVSAKACS